MYVKCKHEDNNKVTPMKLNENELATSKISK